MSLLTSLWSGRSGLQASSTDLSVIGDNISNANTIGFKGSRAAFEDALAQNLMGVNAAAMSQRGLGTKLQAIQRIMVQGALVNTGLATDLAIQGPGFFVVKGNYGGQEGQFYTRAGQFTVDENGMLVNLDGLRVQGYLADAVGNITRQVGDLQVGNAISAPRATTTISIDANLDADATIPPAWDPTDPTGTSNFSTSVTVYDSLGNAHQVEVYFRKNGAGDWEWHAMTDGANVQGGTAGTLSEIASGTLTFGTNGELTAQTQTSNFNPVGATQPQPLTFDFGTDTGSGGTGLDGITQFAGASAASFINQDGYPAGDLSFVTVESDGTVVGTFSNGEVRALGQVVLADFQAPDQLTRLGGNLFGETKQSGEPTIDSAGTGGRGALVSGALEQSNVDLAEEFIRMITAQRGFQANSKVISTSDQLLAELMTLKR
ncbi:MAG: flagellar hook protein FlgE [Deltaproteobacteria bacterium]|nr:MAG: flagellar hook protein FlgE [Deltaproteobacteria bacterium]